MTAGLVVIALAWVAGPKAAYAESDQAVRLDRLERDLRQLQQDYYSSSAQRSAPPSTAGAGPASSDRLDTIEQALRDLRGQIEEQGLKQRQILDRLNALEPQPGAASAPSGPAPAAAPPPPGRSGNAAPAAPEPGTLGTLQATARDDDAVGAVPQKQAPKGEKEHFDAAIGSLYQGDRPGGVKALQSFIKQYPKSKSVPQAHYWLGEAQLADKAYRESAQEFLTVVTKYPKDTIAPKSLVKLGSALIQGGQAKEGCKQLKSIKDVYPKADKTIFEMAVRERKLGNCPA